MKIKNSIKINLNLAVVLLFLSFLFLTDSNSNATGNPDFEKLTRHITQLAGEGKFSGVVLVAEKDKILFHDAWGLASKRYQYPNKKDTKFNLASISKLLTSVSVAQLIEQGKIGIDDPLKKYLDEFPRDVAQKVTIRHLLQMRSGWGDYWMNEDFMASWSFLTKISDYIEFIKKMPLEFEPGTRTIHSNVSFEILGAIIEKVSGVDYYTYVRQNIYQIVGMENSESWAKNEPDENLATGYTNFNPYGPPHTGFPKNNLLSPPVKGTPAGGSYSTAEDLFKFSVALRQHKLLSPKFTNFLLNRFQGSENDKYDSPLPARWIGGAVGVNTFLGIDWKSGYTVIVLANYDMPVATDLGNRIFQEFL